MKCPIALIGFLHKDEYLIKSSTGYDVKSIPREHALCSHAIMSDSPFAVLDASKDVRFRFNPLVRGTPNIRYYMSAPLYSSTGFIGGSICVFDNQPREKCEIQLLVRISYLVQKLLDMNPVTEVEKRVLYLPN